MGFIMKHLKSFVIIIFIGIIVSGITFLNPVEGREATKTNFALNTIITVKAYGKNADKAVDAAMTRIQEIENTMSAYKEDSDIWKINHSDIGVPVKVGKQTFEVIEKALFYSELTRGNFDITIKPLVDLWAISSENPRVPEEEEIKQAIAQIGYDRLKLDKKEHTVQILQEGTGIDLGGIAKGYAADELVRILKEYGIKSAYGDLGGNVIVIGKKRVGMIKYLSSRLKNKNALREKDWTIGLQDPTKSRGTYMATIDVSDEAIVSSGPYERKFEKNGEQYHHILNPFTGYPVSSGLISTTIIAEKSIDADALSTSLFLLGEEKGLELIEAQPGVEAMILDKDKRIRLTKGLKDKIKIASDEYKLK